MRSIVKESTDISGFEVKRLPTVDKNTTLADTVTGRSHFITKRVRQKAKRKRASEIRVNRLIAELEG